MLVFILSPAVMIHDPCRVQSSTSRRELCLRIPIEVGNASAFRYVVADHLDTVALGYVDAGRQRFCRAGEVDCAPYGRRSLGTCVRVRSAGEGVLCGGSFKVILYDDAFLSRAVDGEIEPELVIRESTCPPSKSPERLKGELRSSARGTVLH